MVSNKYTTIIFSFLIVLFGSAIPVFSQNQWNLQDDGCGAVRWYGSPSGTFNLEIKEQTLAKPPKKLSIDGGKNGGVRIIGWERNEIFVRACIQSFGFDAAEARARTSGVRIETADGLIRAVSSGNEDYSFGANYDIRVPMNTDLAIKTVNGGINLANVRGMIEFDLTNGGAILSKIAGDVRGKTVNGGLTLKLDGKTWEGGGIDASTVNGSVSIIVPENYSARIETATQSGNFSTNFPINKVRADKNSLSLDFGTGGATIRALTRNGQVSIRRQAEKGVKSND